MTAPSAGRATFVVCEDGHEYSQRFGRLLGEELDFVRAGDFASALASARSGAAGLLLDLDFRRTPAAALVDEQGTSRGDRPEGESRRLAEVQGILILRALRAHEIRLPALLFADIDDAEQLAFLETSLAPLQVLPGASGIATISTALRDMASALPPT